MKFALKNKIGTIVILLISGLSFLAGFIQESYADAATSLKEDAVILQGQLDRMEGKAAYEMNRDTTFIFNSFAV